MHPKLIAYVIAASLFMGLALEYRSHVYGLGYAAAVSERQASDLKTIALRVQDNKATEQKNAAINANITKVENEKLAPVIRTIYRDRVRIGPSICAAAGTTEAATPGPGETANPGTWLVPPRTEEDIRALEEKVERAFAAGRTCQDWASQHGFVE